MPSVALYNLGCSKNIVDGERIVHLFKDAGYSIVQEFAGAEVIVVNTCAFIREAQEEAIEAILESSQWKSKGRCTKLLVSGCFSERYRERVRKLFPEVDLWVGVRDWETVLAKELAVPSVSPFKRELSSPITTQFLKIAEGCSHACAFCAIPNIRGPYHSRLPSEILEEARWLEAKGTRELILVAQDTSFYGRDINSNFTRLLETLLAGTSVPWIRVMYLHPQHVGDALLALFAGEKRLCPYFDIPLQHIADPILKAMGRSPVSKGIRFLLEKIRTAVPTAALRSSLIAGFPGETEGHFKELAAFIEEVRFDRLGVFPYSPEEGTLARAMRGRPRSATVMRRCETLMLVLRDISREKLAGRVGMVMEVIIEDASDDPSFPLAGRTRFDAPEVDGRVFVARRHGRHASSPFAQVRITRSSDHDLFGEAL